MKPKIGFYSPYLDTFGGGERYILTLASHWSVRFDVELFWNEISIIDSAQKRFNIDLSRVKVTRNIFRDVSVFKKLYITRQYDLIFFLSDGSIPSSLARHNILHFQMPFEKIPYSKIKLSRYQAIICNSHFTKNGLDQRISKRATVIYPPVQLIDAIQTRKEKIIFSVGRFSGYHTAKKQHILLEAFAKGIKANRFMGWKLIFAGGLIPSDEEFFTNLVRKAKGLPVEFYPNTTHDNLVDYYKRASIYWHAAGFGETEARWMEHFGISTVEAMSAGCIPIVYDSGGQPEIVTYKLNGFLWQNIDELIGYTTAVGVDSDISLEIRKNARLRAKEFDQLRFTKSFDECMNRMRF